MTNWYKKKDDFLRDLAKSAPLLPRQLTAADDSPLTYEWGGGQQPVPPLKNYVEMCKGHQWWYEKTDDGYEEYDRWKTNEDRLRSIASGGGGEYQKVYDEEYARWQRRASGDESGED